MALLILACAWMAQDKEAEKAFQEMEKAFQKANTIRVTAFAEFELEGSETRFKQTLDLWIKRPNLVKLSQKYNSGRSEILTICDGRRMVRIDPNEGTGREIPKDLKGNLGAFLTRSGLFFADTSLYTHTMTIDGKPAPRESMDPGKTFTISELKREAEEDSQNVLSYRLKGARRDGELIGRIWYDPADGKLSKRTLSGFFENFGPKLTKGVLTEEYESVILDEPIDDGEFAIPAFEVKQE